MLCCVVLCCVVLCCVVLCCVVLCCVVLCCVVLCCVVLCCVVLCCVGGGRGAAEMSMVTLCHGQVSQVESSCSGHSVLSHRSARLAEGSQAA